MEVFRLSRVQYANTLSGAGAAIKGGRWNSIGFELVYTAGNRSLAMAEVAVHFTIATLPNDYLMVTINIPDDLQIAEIAEYELPRNWNAFPHPSSTQKIGDHFILQGEHCVSKIPSVVTKGDYNFLINPNHRDFKRISISETEKFPFDKRIFK